MPGKYNKKQDISFHNKKYFMHLSCVHSPVFTTDIQTWKCNKMSKNAEAQPPRGQEA